jgi:hypothetical protein
MRPGGCSGSPGASSPATWPCSGTLTELLELGRVEKPTESTGAIDLAWDLGVRAGLKLARTYQLPVTTDGAHRVVFVAKGAVTAVQQAALAGNSRLPRSA